MDNEQHGPASDYLMIDLALHAPPLTFASVFDDADPYWATRTAISRAITVEVGSGTLTLKTQRGVNRVLNLSNGETVEVQALGIEAAAGITLVKVLL